MRTTLALEVSTNLLEDGAKLTKSAILHPDEFFNLKQSLQLLRNSAASDPNDTFGPDDSWWERPVSLNQKAFLLSLTSDNSDSTLHLLVRAAEAAESPTAKDIRAAVEWVERRFLLDVDMEAVRTTLLVNPFGEGLVNRFWPLRPANLPDAWEGLLKTVVGVQVYPGLAQQLLRSLLDLYGQPVRFGDRTYHLYPTPQKLATIPTDELLAVKFSRQKASYVVGISRAVLTQPDKYDWKKLRALPVEEAVAVLDELRGVGPWIANYCAMRALPHPDVAINDECLRDTLTGAYNLVARLSVGESAKLMAVFAPYRTFAYTYANMLREAV